MYGQSNNQKGVVSTQAREAQQIWKCLVLGRDCTIGLFKEWKLPPFSEKEAILQYHLQRVTEAQINLYKVTPLFRQIKQVEGSQQKASRLTLICTYH